MKGIEVVHLQQNIQTVCAIPLLLSARDFLIDKRSVHL